MIEKIQLPFKYLDWGGTETGKLIHFAHGNGFPPETYSPFINEFLQDFRVISWKCYGENFPLQPKDLTHWKQIAEQLASFFSKLTNSPSILMGHSFGAVISLYAAFEYSVPFESIVLIDPVIFSSPFLLYWRFLKYLKGRKDFALSRKTKMKRDKWTSREEMAASYRQKDLFREWKEVAFNLYIQHALVKDGDGFSLSFPKLWEAAIFETTPDRFWSETKKWNSEKIIAVRGEKSITFTKFAFKQFLNRFPDSFGKQFPEVDHCLIMEKPHIIGKQIYEELKHKTSDFSLS